MSLLSTAFKRDWIDKYFQLQKEIYDYFSYVEDWRIYPLSDETEYFWQLVGDGVSFWKEKPSSPWAEPEYYHERGHDRFLPTWYWVGEDYTLVLVDTHVDGNKLLSIFDNRKQVGL